ncbi:hypothetical protein FQZ97_880580 [compost metagenome]
MLGFENVRAPLQQVRRQPGRHLAEQLGVERLTGGQIRRQAAAQEQGEAVAVLRDQALVLRQLDPGAFDRGARLAQVERRRHADLAAAQGQLVALLVGAEGVFGQLQQGLIGLPGQVGIGDTGDQADLRGAPRLFAGQVDFQRLLAEAAHATEQVQLIGADTEGRRVLAADPGASGLFDVRRQALPAAAAIRAERRQQVGALDAVLRAVGLDIQDGDAQIAVIHQRGLDQLLQGRVAEVVAPALFGGGAGDRLGWRIGLALRPLAGDRRGRLLVSGDQRAATEQQGGDCDGD